MSTPVVLVTGANKGLGYATVEVLCERQPTWRYILASRDPTAGQDAARQIEQKTNAQVEVLELDVTKDEHISKAVQFIGEKFGRLDVLINNAGILRPPEWESMPLREVINQTVNVNLTSVAVLTTEFLPLLHKATDPKVINNTSGISSFNNILTMKIPRVVPYGASKTGMNGLTIQMQAHEWDRIKGEKDKGLTGDAEIRFYVCQPGVTRTSFTGYTVGKHPQEGAEVMVRLALDGERTYPGGTYWEYKDEKMSQVPW